MEMESIARRMERIDYHFYTEKGDRMKCINLQENL